jgi:hypothetical protein
VERALTLIADGIITIESINEARGKIPALPKTINTNTGKPSTTALAFNDDSWGKVSRSYTKSARKMVAQSVAKFEAIEKAAIEFAKTNTRVMESTITSELAPDATSEDDDDGRGNLSDNDSDDSIN